MHLFCIMINLKTITSKEERRKKKESSYNHRTAAENITWVVLDAYSLGFASLSETEPRKKSCLR